MANSATLFCVHSLPPNVDTAAVALAIAPEVREYMARGVIDDAEIDLDSDIASITFGG
ncbi:MAG: hypothetical protein ABI042_13335 [Verrucomicrobiota bacterium]